MDYYSRSALVWAMGRNLVPETLCLSAPGWTLLALVTFCAIDRCERFPLRLGFDSRWQRHTAIYIVALIFGSLMNLLLADASDPQAPEPLLTTITDLTIVCLCNPIIQSTLKWMVLKLDRPHIAARLDGVPRKGAKLGAVGIVLLLRTHPMTSLGISRFEKRQAILAILCSIIRRPIARWLRPWIRRYDPLQRWPTPPKASQNIFYQAQLSEEAFERFWKIIISIPQLFAKTVMTPLCEEIYWRGFLYSSLRKHMGVIPAVILNGVEFGLMHGYDKVSDVGVGGMMYAGIFEQSDFSIWPCIAAHALWNTRINSEDLLRTYKLRIWRHAKIRIRRRTDEVLRKALTGEPWTRRSRGKRRASV